MSYHMPGRVSCSHEACAMYRQRDFFASHGHSYELSQDFPRVHSQIVTSFFFFWRILAPPGCLVVEDPTSNNRAVVVCHHLTVNRPT